VSIVANILASLAVAVLKWASARHDLKESVRKGIALESEKWAKEAYKWKAENPVRLDDLPESLRLRKRSK